MTDSEPWTTTKETIGPDQARQMLRLNSKNRWLRPTRIEMYAKQMSNGEWLDCVCPPLVFGEGGVLIDGQHRLHAQVLSGTTHTWEIRRVRGVSQPMGLPLDIGLRRTPADLLQENRSIAEVVSCAARCLSPNNTPDLALLMACRGTFASSIAELMECAPSRSRGVSAGIRLGVVLCMMSSSGEARDWVKEQYRVFTTGDVKSMADPVLSTWRRVKERSSMMGSGRQASDVVLGRSTFRYDGRRRQRVLVTAEGIESIRAEIHGHLCV